MSTKRITPKEILAAYEKLGATPIRGRWWDAEKRQGDGVGVYCVAVLGHSGEHGVGMFAMAMEMAGFDKWYIHGFQCGFEDCLFPREPDPHAQGQADGRAAWDAVKHLAPTT